MNTKRWEGLDTGLPFLLRIQNVAWYEKGEVRILDRRKYPNQKKFVICTNYKDVVNAISDMVTQSGGPYKAAVMGMALAAYEARNMKENEFGFFIDNAAYELSHARPTTSTKMNEITKRAAEIAKEAQKIGKPCDEMVFEYAINYINENYACINNQAKYLVEKIENQSTIITQCFADTVVGMLLRECLRLEKNIKVICPETRPYLQGARLTASVVCEMGFDVTVITDNMVGIILKDKNVSLFTSAADLITMDGHIVNKIGTFSIALCSKYFNIPYYVTGIPNKTHSNDSSIQIEYREPSDVTSFLGINYIMKGVKGLYPAFDITPPELCKGVITDRGIFGPHELHRYFKTPQKQE